MSFKLIASMKAGKYSKGEQITDADEIAKVLAGPMRKRFVRVGLHESEMPHEPAVSDEPAAPDPTDEAPSDHAE